MLTSLATGLRSFCCVPVSARRRRGGQLAGRDQGGVRVVPAAGERLGGRALRQRLLDRRGGRAVAACVGLLHAFGTWRPVFLITGSLGLLWLLLFRCVYHPPESHPRISAEERDYILADRGRARRRGGR